MANANKDTASIGYPHKAEREAWIRGWIEANFSASSVDEHFHEAYHKAFPQYKRKETMWGSQPVARAMKDLSAMVKQGIFNADRTGLGENWQPGFPSHVLIYTL